MEKLELIKVFRKFGITLRLWTVRNSSHLAYELKSGRKVIFEGCDFGPSPCHAIDSLDTVEALLDFLTLRPGDTDREYFAAYTPSQVAWIYSDQADEVRMWIAERMIKREG